MVAIEELREDITDEELAAMGLVEITPESYDELLALGAFDPHILALTPCESVEYTFSLCATFPPSGPIPSNPAVACVADTVVALAWDVVIASANDTVVLAARDCVVSLARDSVTRAAWDWVIASARDSVICAARDCVLASAKDRVIGAARDSVTASAKDSVIGLAAGEVLCDV
jgi:hypothetical protein